MTRRQCGSDVRVQGPAVNPLMAIKAAGEEAAARERERAKNKVRGAVCVLRWSI